MSSDLRALKRFGNILGAANDDCRVVVGGTLVKTGLAVTASYNPVPTARTTTGPPFAGRIPAYNADRFWGRLMGFEGIPDTVGLSAVPLDLTTLLTDQSTVLFDHALPTVGPWTFLFPLSQLEANLKTSEGGILTIILGRGFTDDQTQIFIPRLTVSGQTTRGGGYI